MSPKKDLRNQFVAECLQRDGFACRTCGFKPNKSEVEQALAVHHITDRKEMPNGGYVPENGITLCKECHWKAEQYHAVGEALEGWHPDDLYSKIHSSKEKAVIASTKLEKKGQALVEFTVVLVVMLVLVLALLQIGSLSRAHLSVVNEARGQAGMSAISDTYQSLMPSGQLIQEWTVGHDGVRYSRDDVNRLASPLPWRQHILAVAKPSDIERRVPNNRISALDLRNPLIEELDFVRAHEESRPVILLPGVRHLLYDADQITMESDCVQVWLKGMY